MVPYVPMSIEKMIGQGVGENRAANIAWEDGSKERNSLLFPPFCTFPVAYERSRDCILHFIFDKT